MRHQNLSLDEPSQPRTYRWFIAEKAGATGFRALCQTVRNREQVLWMRKILRDANSRDFVVSFPRFSCAAEGVVFPSIITGQYLDIADDHRDVLQVLRLVARSTIRCDVR